MNDDYDPEDVDFDMVAALFALDGEEPPLEVSEQCGAHWQSKGTEK